ncbi:TIGR03943 family putative permease subunit [Streptomyces sp. NBC_00986]|uniref:TIGR03943 family putative permease subunit n=1 Tax=Streptomyces sp. NBC_00986 TaxID=2903702 RepID=UPI0038672B88|nr:TIGR03943 family protein [Streptomyces sp. NBC_00986]
MRRPLQVTLLVLSGLGLLHASLFTDLCLRYVKPSMRPMLVVSGFLLILLGIAEAWSRSRQNADVGDHHMGHDHTDGNHTEHPEEHMGHNHSKVPRVAWLLFLPALSLLFYAPPALGAYTASRAATKAVPVQDAFDPLPATSPLPMTLTDFTTRVQQDHKRAIKGRTVQMTGFVTPDKGSAYWDLTRIMISCCAADAQSIKVRVYGIPALSANTWVTITGTWHASGTLGTSSAVAALDGVTVAKVAKPVNAYQDALPFGSPR